MCDAHNIETFAWDAAGDLLIKTYYDMPPGSVRATTLMSSSSARKTSSPTTPITGRGV
jgi:hypothetical protein